MARKVLIAGIMFMGILGLIGCGKEVKPPDGTVETVTIFSSSASNETVTESKEETMQTGKTSAVKETTESKPKSTQQTVKQQSTEIKTAKQTTNKTSKSQTQKSTKAEKIDIDKWVGFSKSYATSIGLKLDSTARDCWDNPITVNAGKTNLKSDIKGRLNRYKNVEGCTSVWIWAKKVSDTEYELYIGYA